MAKTTSRTRTTTRKPTVRKRRAKKTASSEARDIKGQVSELSPKKPKQLNDKDIIPYMSDTTREQLRKLGDKLSEATDRGTHVARDIAERVRHFAAEATELTKLKIEIHKIKTARDKLIFSLGEKTISLHKAKKLHDIESVFSDDFTKLEELKTKLAEREKAVKKISL
jgi:hypothetical protein